MTFIRSARLLVTGALLLLGPRLARSQNVATAWMYGNYCGPGFSGGHLVKPGTSCANKTWPQPKDSLDELCYYHDLRYCSNDPKQQKAADAELLQGLENLPADPRKWPVPPKNPELAAAYTLGATAVFTTKNNYLGDKERAQLAATVARLPSLKGKVAAADKWIPRLAAITP